MASPELINEWNRQDENGAIQPPLSDAEVDAFDRVGVHPDTEIRFEPGAGRVYHDVARIALIQCAHIRTPRKPGLAADTLRMSKAD